MYNYKSVADCYVSIMHCVYFMNPSDDETGTIVGLFYLPLHISGYLLMIVCKLNVIIGNARLPLGKNHRKNFHLIN